jgi:hypothetical protein
VQVGAADAAGEHADEELTRRRLGRRPLLEPERAARCVEDHRPHSEECRS